MRCSIAGGLAIARRGRSVRFLGWRAGRKIEQPISALIRSADRIGQGDYTRPLDIVRRDELGELQQALERMRGKLRQSTINKNYLTSVLNSMTDAVFVTSPDGVIKTANTAACKLLGYSEEEVLGRGIAAILDECEREDFDLLQAAQETRETVVRTRNGQTIPVSLTGSQIASDDPQFQGNIFVARNITDRKRAERRIRYLARYDALTKVPNRMQFHHLLQQAIARGLRSGQSVALLYLDMDRFKEVNDTFGHGSGDRVLEVLAERLTRALPKDTVIGRLAGDEFALFVDGLPAESGQPRADRAPRALDPHGRVPRLPAEPARSVPHREHRHRVLPARCGERDRPDPQRRRGDVLLQAERRQHVRLLLAGDERRGGRAADAEEQAAPRARARRAGDPLPAEGGSALRAASSAPRRCCAGGCRATATFRRASSFRWRKRPTSSSISASGC